MKEDTRPKGKENIGREKKRLSNAYLEFCINYTTILIIKIILNSSKITQLNQGFVTPSFSDVPKSFVTIHWLSFRENYSLSSKVKRVKTVYIRINVGRVLL